MSAGYHVQIHHRIWTLFPAPCFTYSDGEGGLVNAEGLTACANMQLWVFCLAAPGDVAGRDHPAYLIRRSWRGFTRSILVARVEIKQEKLRAEGHYDDEDEEALRTTRSMMRTMTKNLARAKLLMN